MGGILGALLAPLVIILPIIILVSWAITEIIYRLINK